VAYGSLLLFSVPGILKDPLMYDLALSFIPPSFYIMAVLGGGVATFLKKMAGVDLRGRALELVVVLLTSWLLYVSWGVVWGFFGSPENCVGVMTSTSKTSSLLNGMERFVLKPAKTYFLFWDKLATKFDRVRAIMCTTQENDAACFPYLSQADPEVLLSYPSCAGDIQLVTGMYLAAGATLALSSLWKRRRRGGRPHQD
jgi:hypothetical protein